MDLSSLVGGISALAKKRKIESLSRDLTQAEAKVTAWKSFVYK